MACCPVPCHEENALTWLLCSDPEHVSAALGILTELAQDKDRCFVERILQEPDLDSCIAVLGLLVNSLETWLSSSALYLLGLLLEHEAVVRALQESEKGSSDHLLLALAQHLNKDDPDTVMTAAGAIASLVESTLGRDWLLRSPDVFSEVLESLCGLLEHERDGTINSAALILARLSLCEEACQRLLSHPTTAKTFRRLAHCLAHCHTDTAMNAAFAIGRLCGSEQGRGLIMAEAKELQLVSKLQVLLCKASGLGAGQTACFALSCLAAEEDGHVLVLGSPSLPGVLNGLLQSLQMGDSDSAWFAAMTLRVFVSRPDGVCRVREHGLLENELKSLSLSSSTVPELQEEVSACLRKLRRLPKPAPVTASHLSSGTLSVSWEKCDPESGLEVTYSLLDKGTVVYRGPQCHVSLPLCALQPDQPLSLQLRLSTAGGDVSPCSDCVVVEAERPRNKPGPPRELHVVGCTTTQVRLSWAPPEGEVKHKSYQIYRGDAVLDTTTEPGTVVSGLSPGCTYQIRVCAMGLRNTAGPPAELEVRTAESQDHAPSRLTVVVLGRHELHVSWGAPRVLLGRLFNYELRLNGSVEYLGTERAHTARRLSANTSYTCTVTAITSRGRCESRPVTKRTARDEYLHTQRCLYTPSRQPSTSQPVVLSPLVREVSEVRENVKRLSPPHGRQPKVHLTVRQLRDPDRHKAKPRPKSSNLQSQCRESSHSPNHTAQKSVGLVSGYGGNGPWKSTREGSDTDGCPVTANDQPLHPPRGKTECKVQSKLKALQFPSHGPRHAKAHLSPVEAVGLTQTVSYTWAERPRTGCHPNRAFRNRTLTERRVKSTLRGRDIPTTN